MHVIQSHSYTINANYANIVEVLVVQLQIHVSLDRLTGQLLPMPVKMSSHAAQNKGNTRKTQIEKKTQKTHKSMQNTLIKIKQSNIHSGPENNCTNFNAPSFCNRLQRIMRF